MGACTSCCIKDSEAERENTAKAYNDLVSRFNAEGGWDAAQYDLATPSSGKGLGGHHHHRNEEAALLSVERHQRQHRHGYGAVENNEREKAGTSNRNEVEAGEWVEESSSSSSSRSNNNIISINFSNSCKRS